MIKQLLLPVLLLFIAQTYAVSEKPYFQQEVNYKINVRLNDLQHTLTANIEIEYINRSSDTLTDIWMHLWPNAYKDRTSALCKQMLEDGDPSLYFAEDINRGYIDSLAFTLDDETANWTYDKTHQDICVIHLNKPLLPGQRVFIKTPFFVKLPSARFSRLGHIGQAYAITQWYPKPAVYDNRGWHAMPYLTQGEFYSEFGAYEVTITLPSNYVVGATGDLQTESEVQWMDQQSKEEVPVSKDLSFPPSDVRTKTITYTQNSIHDFGWFADKRFHVSKGSVALPGSGRTVTTWALYTNHEAPLWKNAIEYINDAVSYYSKWIGEYPYRQCTAVDGTIAAGGGMEYPNVTIIGSSGDPLTLEITIAHEVGHNWFYGMLGSNEREHPWMDEGINSFYESRYIMEKYPPQQFGNKNELGSYTSVGQQLGLDRFNYEQASFLEYMISASNHRDQPIEGNSTLYTPINYGTIVYKKTAVAFDYLRKYLGDDLYDKSMQAYFKQWIFKHPYPEDIQKVFETTSGKNLDWFFKELLTTTPYQDFKLRKVKKESEKITFSVKECSGLKAPFSVSGYKDGIKVTEQWYEKEELNTSLSLTCRDCDRLLIDADEATLDINRRNNSSRRTLFPSLHLFPKAKSESKSYLFITPVVGWNNYNKVMLGAALYNTSLPVSKFEYILIPLYAFGDKTINGTGTINYSFYLDCPLIREIKLSQNFRKFSYLKDQFRNQSYELIKDVFAYSRYSPSLTFYIRNKNLRSAIRQKVKLQSIHIWEENPVYVVYDMEFIASKKSLYRDFYRLQYSIENKTTIDPWSVKLQTEANHKIIKADLEFKYHITYKLRGRGADIRIFAGNTLTKNPERAYGYFLSDRSGAYGTNDYAYDEWYFGRTETKGLGPHQMALRQGQFKVATPFGAYKKWIVAVNLSADLPIPFPIRLYADIGTTEGFKEDVQLVYNVKQSVSYNAGICLNAINNTLQVYLPLLNSDEIKQYLDFNRRNLINQIRFVFNIDKMNPLNARNQLID